MIEKEHRSTEASKEERTTKEGTTRAGATQDERERRRARATTSVKRKGPQEDIIEKACVQGSKQGMDDKGGNDESRSDA